MYAGSAWFLIASRKTWISLKNNIDEMEGEIMEEDFHFTLVGQPAASPVIADFKF